MYTPFLGVTTFMTSHLSYYLKPSNHVKNLYVTLIQTHRITQVTYYLFQIKC